MIAVAVPVKAHASSASLIVDTDSVDAWTSYFNSNYILGDTTELEGIFVDLSFIVPIYWGNFDQTFLDVGIGLVNDMDELGRIATSFSKRLKVHDSSLLSSAYWLCLGRPVPEATIAYDSELNVYRLQDSYSGLWLVNSAGHFPYYRADTGDDGSTVYRTGQWLPAEDIKSNSDLWHAVSTYELEQYRDQWSDITPSANIYKTDGCYWLIYYDDFGKPWILCDEYDYPYFVPIPGQSAVSTPNQYFTNVTNNYVDDNDTTVNVVMDGNTLVGQVIDNENGIISVGGEIYYIDNLYYDASTKTYYVDAHEEYIYNSSTNNYTTNYSTSQVVYNVSYTSITYIGQTEEYQERYELYYQLPDGRSSADLTAEDLEQLSLVFADVMTYARASDDIDMRLLYHFDGNTEDSSYWGYCTSFEWSVGASLTYLDEGTFGGSLYLDETAHDFTMTLPSGGDLAGDFTLQFRYYQSHTEAPASDSAFYFGSEPWLVLDGANYMAPDLTVLSATSVGTWNEICVMRSNFVLYYYLNGVCIYSADCPDVLDAQLRFMFGASQQTYKKLDELRFSRKAIYTAGENYTPTSVPFDSNLALVLPDGEDPVADEIMTLKKYANNRVTPYDDWRDGAPVSDMLEYGSSGFGSDSGSVFKSQIYMVYNPDYTSVSDGDVGGVVTSSTTGYKSSSNSSSSPYVSITAEYLTGGLFVPITGYTSVGGTKSSTWVVKDKISSSGANYNFTVLLSDGTYSVLAFHNSGSSGTIDKKRIEAYCVDSSAVTLTMVEYTYTVEDTNPITSTTTTTVYSVTGIHIRVNSDAEIVYMELGGGYDPRFSYDWEQAIYTSGQLENAPVLAVRTNFAITGYQIGGIRPSYPEKGLVYAMVENSRITSLQQYSGSAWIAVDGRIWTGERWIPYSSFDVFTLQDCYDVLGGSSDDYEYIYSETGFWAWFQKQWLVFMGKIDQIKESIAPRAVCEHLYEVEVVSEPSCVQPGSVIYTCENCGDTFSDIENPHGHDWFEDGYVEDVTDEAGDIIEPGYELLVCTVCGSKSRDYGGGPVDVPLTDYTEPGFWFWWQNQWFRFTKSESDYHNWLKAWLQDYLDTTSAADQEYRSWWQEQWEDFSNSLFKEFKKLGDSGDTTVIIQNNTIIDEEDKQSFDQDVYKGIVKTLRNGVNFLSGFFSFTYDGVNGFFDFLSDDDSEFFGLFSLDGLGG